MTKNKMNLKEKAKKERKGKTTAHKNQNLKVTTSAIVCVLVLCWCCVLGGGVGKSAAYWDGAPKALMHLPRAWTDVGSLRAAMSKAQPDDAEVDSLHCWNLAPLHSNNEDYLLGYCSATSLCWWNPHYTWSFRRKVQSSAHHAVVRLSQSWWNSLFKWAGFSRVQGATAGMQFAACSSFSLRY